MRENSAIRLYTLVAIALTVLAVTASPATAQFTSRALSDRATGERYHIEASIGLWNPSANMSISSESLGIKGDTIDFKDDLGLTDQSFRELHAVLRPAKKHKFRYSYINMVYEQSAVISRNIVFNGQNFTASIPVNSLIDWKAHRFSYEYDFIYKSRGFGGVVLDIKQTDVLAALESPSIRRESAQAAAPIPAIGGIFRAYVMPNISITGEITGFRVPDGLFTDVSASYIEADFYGTVNFNDYIGAQIGFRSLTPNYHIDDDVGDFSLKGMYFTAVVRY